MKLEKTLGPKPWGAREYGKGAKISASIKYHSLGQAPYFSITGSITTPASRRKNDIEAGGQIREDLGAAFPELAPYFKFHLMTREAPMHYVANTVYHVQQDRLDYARSTAVWPDATDEDLALEGLEDRLAARLPALRAEFEACLTHFFGQDWK